MKTIKYQIFYKNKLVDTVGYGIYSDIISQAMAGCDIVQFRGKEYDTIYLDIKEVVK